MDHKCLLGVYAHPADESFAIGGTLRKYSDMGIRTALVCATLGEAYAPDEIGLATPAGDRALHVACEILGVDDLSVLDYPSGALAYADAIEVIGQLVYHIRRLRPQVVVTFDEPGAYGDLDHAAIHRLTVGAFFRANDTVWYPEQLQEELQPHQPQKLYVSMLGQLRTQAPSDAEDATPARPPGGSIMRGAESLIRIALDDQQLGAKLAALRVYQGQSITNVAAGAPRDTVRSLLAIECFKCLAPHPPSSEDDLFDGVAAQLTI